MAGRPAAPGSDGSPHQPSRSWTAAATSASGSTEPRESAPRRTAARFSSRTRQPGSSRISRASIRAPRPGRVPPEGYRAPAAPLRVEGQGLEREFAPPKAHEDGAAHDPYGRSERCSAPTCSASRGSFGSLATMSPPRSRRTTETRSGVRRSSRRTIEAAADNVFAVFERPEMQSSAPHRRQPSSGNARGRRVTPLITRFAVHTGRLVSKEHGGTSVLHLVLLLEETSPGRSSFRTRPRRCSKVNGSTRSLRDLGERHLPRLGASTGSSSSSVRSTASRRMATIGP